MAYEELKEHVFRANMGLVEAGLVDPHLGQRQRRSTATPA